MPPKKQAQPSKKAEQKRKEKLIEDKTFGLKNKNKSSKVQKYVQEVAKQVKAGGQTRADRLKAEAAAAKKKDKNSDDVLKSLFAAAITQPKVPPGVDPKSIVCEFFKAGVCTKVCKYFLDAIEKSLYGWFWVCPNGGTACKYRHALPPGYVFKSKKDRDAEKSKKVDDISIEEIIEQQRAKLGPTGGTPVTAETLAAYKKEKLERKRVEEEKRLKEEAKKTGGRGPMSGRALFTYDPTLFRDDADADEDRYSVHSYNEDDDDEAKPSAVDAAAAVMDKSLYLQDADDLESLKE
ncbi:hypothetical protein P43SY_010522 [Pythium insidiosum]|uniref:C3H1-type domain-containing protein n=1 Tax=Pythium insidiosum TaxID=114742 RepID=A0AAD5Q5H5_PYTIN|nr:hypothetical protein P43SY_010522 [Pythium insidiosum]